MIFLARFRSLRSYHPKSIGSYEDQRDCLDEKWDYFFFSIQTWSQNHRIKNHQIEKFCIIFRFQNLIMIVSPLLKINSRESLSQEIETLKQQNTTLKMKEWKLPTTKSRQSLLKLAQKRYDIDLIPDLQSDFSKFTAREKDCIFRLYDPPSDQLMLFKDVRSLKNSLFALYPMMYMSKMNFKSNSKLEVLYDSLNIFTFNQVKNWFACATIVSISGQITFSATQFYLCTLKFGLLNLFVTNCVEFEEKTHRFFRRDECDPNET